MRKTPLAQERAMERDLRASIRQSRLALAFQPLHDLETGELRAFEALVRWPHRRWRTVAPSQFVRIAEERGLVIPLGGWVLDEACRQAAAWRRWSARQPGVCVNVSPLQFADEGFHESVVAALGRHDLPPAALELEITETVALDGLVDRRRFDDLERLGVRIAIDDFGSGYSSLAYLRDLPVDTVKVDRLLMWELASLRTGPHFALALVEAITRMAQYLEFEVVAEGIETRAQRDLAQSLGCGTGQGFYFAEPMDADCVAGYLNQRLPVGEVGRVPAVARFD